MHFGNWLEFVSMSSGVWTFTHTAAIGFLQSGRKSSATTSSSLFHVFLKLTAEVFNHKVSWIKMPQIPKRIQQAPNTIQHKFQAFCLDAFVYMSWKKHVLFQKSKVQFRLEDSWCQVSLRHPWSSRCQFLWLDAGWSRMMQLYTLMPHASQMDFVWGKTGVASMIPLCPALDLSAN